MKGNYVVNPSSELDKGRQEGHVSVREMQRRLPGLPSAGNQPGDGIDDKVGRAAMTGVFNLRDILELVNDGPDDEAFRREQFVFENNESILHVFADGRDRQRAVCRHQLQSACEELLKESLGEIAAVRRPTYPIGSWSFVGRACGHLCCQA